MKTRPGSPTKDIVIQLATLSKPKTTELLETKESPTLPSPSLALELTDVQRNALKKLTGFTLPKKNPGLDTVCVVLQKLSTEENTTKDDQHKLAIKEYQLVIIKAFMEHLLPLNPSKKKPAAFYKSILQRLGYGFLLIAGLIMDGIGSFLGGVELINMLPGITGPTAMVAGVIFSVINTALFYSFEAGMLRRAMGMKSLDTLSLHLAIDEKEMILAHKINRYMQKEACTTLDADTYHAYARLTGVINETIQNKTHFEKKKVDEEILPKIFRYLVTSIGALMTIASGYFMVKSLLLFIAPALIGTPFGWAIIGIGISTMLAYYFSMRGQAMMNSLNPSIQKFKDVRKQFNQFTQYDLQTEKSLRDIYDSKQTVEKLKKDNTALRKQVEELLLTQQQQPKPGPPPHYTATPGKSLEPTTTTLSASFSAS